MRKQLTRRFIKASFALSICIFFSSSKGLSEEIKWARLDVYERTSQGTLIGCELSFKAIGRDNHYATGTGVVIVSGAQFFYISDSLGEGFKVCGYDVDENDYEPFSVHYAYPIVRGTSLHKREAAGRVIDKCHVAVYRPFSVPELNFLGMKIAYNREEGGQDVIVDLDFYDYVDVADAEAKYAGCKLRLLESIK